MGTIINGVDCESSFGKEKLVHQSLKESDFKAVWTSIEYSVKDRKSGKRTLLNNFSGFVDAGQIVAVLGPSGAGKSTFLNCLSGTVKPTKGKITFWAREKQATLAYVPQLDQLCIFLTVKESLILSSRLKNHWKLVNLEEHEALVDKVMKLFSLEDCRDNLVKLCSGGESKRLSIALEVVSEPKLLLLDEPTSGLDSTTALKCINSLKSCISTDRYNQPGVLLTIHQPSSELFSLFDKIYLLTKGNCIYGGSPRDVVNYFAQFNAFCPKYHNPADFVLRVATESSYAEVSEKLNKTYLEVQSSADVKQYPMQLKEIKPEDMKTDRAFLLAYFLLVKKLVVCNFRDPHQLVSRILQYVIYPLIVYFMIADSFGLKKSGCAYMPQNKTHLVDEDLYTQFFRQKVGYEGLILIFFNSFFAFISALFPGILSCGSHIRVFAKEHQNNWYSLTSFFLSLLSISSLFSILFASINSTCVYFLYEKQLIWSTLLLYTLVNILSALMGDATSVLISVLNPMDQLTNVMIGGVTTFVLLILSGVLTRLSNFSPWAFFLTTVSCFRYILQLIIKILFYDHSCALNDGMHFSFPQVNRIIDYYNHRTNVSTFSMQGLTPELLDVLKEESWRLGDIFSFAGTIGNLNETQVNNLKRFFDLESNYMLPEYGIQNPNIGDDIFHLVFLFLLLNIISYITLFIKTRR